jgi:hypothetical protein
VSQSNRRYYNKPIVHHYGKSIVVQKVKIARSCPALHTLSVTIVTHAQLYILCQWPSLHMPSFTYFVSDHRYTCPALHTLSVTIVTYAVTTLFPYFNIIFNLVSSCIWKERKTNKQYCIQTLEKTESAIKYGESRETGNIGYSRHRTKTKKNTTQKIKKMSNTDPTKNRGWIQTSERGKQFLHPTRHPPCYSYSQYVLDNTIHKKAQIT